MDPLSDVLRAVRLNGAFFYAVEAAGPWSAEALPAAELKAHILPDAEHLMPYHILTAGRCWGGLLDEPPVELLPGDAIVFPQGDAHLMSSAPGVRFEYGPNRMTPERYPHTVKLGSGNTEKATFVCGFLGCDLRPFNPLLAALPRQVHVRGLSRGWAGAFARQVVEESRAGRAGADSVLARLAEVMFIEVVRQHLEALPAEQRGWLAGLRDPVVLPRGEPGCGWAWRHRGAPPTLPEDCDVGNARRGSRAACRRGGPGGGGST